MSKWFTLEGDGSEFGTFQDSRVDLSDIAEPVWSDKKNSYGRVKQIAVRRPDFARMEGSSLYVEIATLKEALSSIPRSEELAKELLLKFDFSFIPKALARMHEKLLDTQIAKAEAALKKLKCNRRLVPSRHRSMTI